MANYGFKVAEPGYDARTAEDKNLSLKSGLTLLKVFEQDTIDLSSTWTEITHNLGYIPQFMVYVYDTTNGKVYFATADLNTAIARADTTKIYIKKINADQTKAYYYIFYEPAETGTEPDVTFENDYGFSIVKENVDVREAGVFDFTFHSTLNSLKIALDDTYTSSASGSRTVNIEHGLDNIPGYIIYYEVDGSGDWYPMFAEEDSSGKDVVVTAWGETDYVKVNITSTGSASVKIRYVVFVDPGEEP